MVFVGPSGSGKSTYAEQLKKIGYAHVSSDCMRALLYGDESVQTNPAKVFKFCKELTAFYLNRGINVVFDATNLTRRDRIKLLKGIKELLSGEYEVEYNCEVFTTSIETCITRQNMRSRKVSEEVIRKQFKKYQEPSIDEGWTGIYTLVNNGK